VSASFVTVDYDFFIPHKMYEDVEFPDGKILPGELVFDWQMDEGRAPAFDEAIWRNRAANFATWGLDIQAMTMPTLSFEDFSAKLSARMGDYSTPMAWRGDSHGWAGIIVKDFAEMHGPMNVVNFDAHHDLGYGSNALKDFAEKNSVGCDNWAVIGLSQGWIKNYTVIYPDWLGRREWNSLGGAWKNREWLQEFRKQIKITTWNEWHDEIPETEAMYYCRSSSWVPPWRDPGFDDLTAEISYADCIDCALGQANTPYDTCKHRNWDWDDVLQEVEIRSASMRALEQARTTWEDRELREGRSVQQTLDVKA
jgi:hypothetical protein